MINNRHIFCMGGGGWMMDEVSSPMESYLCNLSESKTPAICLLPTACGDATDVIDKFYASHLSTVAHLSHISFFKPPFNWQELLLSQDIIYVGGGNTRSMLAIWKEWGVDRILKQAYEQGVILSGMSAGANCWFEECLTDSNPGILATLKGLGFLKGSCSPHYRQAEGRRKQFKALIGEQKLLPGYAIDDCVALHFSDGELQAVIKSEPSNKAYFVGEDCETELYQGYSA